MSFYYGLMYASVLLGAVGQVLLKLGAGGNGRRLWFLRLNGWIMLGLTAMVAAMLLSVRGLSVVPLRDMAFILPTVYIAVPLFSRIFLKERLPPRVLGGTGILIIGIVVFNILSLRMF